MNFLSQTYRGTPVIVWVHGSAFFGGPHLLGTPPAFTWHVHNNYTQLDFQGQP